MRNLSRQLAKNHRIRAHHHRRLGQIPGESTENAGLAYAGNVFVAQGSTVGTMHLVVSEGMPRDLLYVRLTRAAAQERRRPP